MTIGLLEMTTLGCSILAAYLISRGCRSQDDRHIKGTQFAQRMLSQEETDERRYLWGTVFMTFAEACKHFLIVGSTGSGKTLVISLLMKNVMRQIRRENTNTRAVVYDSKTDLLSTLKGMELPEEQIVILNPFDARASAWHMAADITDPSQADDVSSVLIPGGTNENNPYFNDTARRFLAGIIEVFIERAGEDWTLRDLVLASKSPERLKAILRSSSETEDLEQHFEPPQTFASVNSTLSGHLRKYRSIAAIWHHAGNRKFSIKEWLHSQQVLVLGNSPRAKEPIQRLNSLLFTEIAKEVLSVPGRSDAENWMFLDEFGDLGELPNLVDLMKLGRSKGAGIVLGAQDIADIDSIYGKDRSRTILGNAQNLGIVHINSTQPDTQKWASEVLGEHRILRTESGESESVSRQASSRATNSSEKLVTESVWLPSQFSSDLPPASLEEGLTGIFRVGRHFFPQNIAGDILFGDRGKVNRVPSPDPGFPDLVPPPSNEVFRLGDWTVDDLARLGIPELLDCGFENSGHDENEGDILGSVTR